MKAAIKQAFLDAPQKDAEAFKKLSDGKEPAVATDRERGLQQDHRADQIRRRPPQRRRPDPPRMQERGRVVGNPAFLF